MPDNKDKFALKFDLKVKTSEKEWDYKNKESLFREFFIPYPVDTLVQGEFLSVKEEIVLSNCIADYTMGNLTVENSSPSLKDSDWINKNGECEDICLFDYFSDFLFVKELMKSGEDSGKIKLGVFTELMKLKFFQFKIDFSILYNLFYDKNLDEKVKSDMDSYTDIIYVIVQRNLLETNFENSRLSVESIKEELATPNELLDKLCCLLYEDMKEEVQKLFEPIDEAYLNFLKKVIEDESTLSKYRIKDSGCLCVVENGDKLYFALSGSQCTDDYYSCREGKKILRETIKNMLKTEFCKKAENCEISAKMKAYGVKVGKNFVHFPMPLEYSQNTLIELRPEYCYLLNECENVQKIRRGLFACCERKVFAKIRNTSPMKVFCRWSPCEKCQTAVFEEISKHDYFEYIALAKDAKKFHKYLKEFGTTNAKLWKLTKNELFKH